MRALVLVLPASLMFVAGVNGQALTEHAAAAAGAAIGTGAGKSLSDSMTKIFGDTDKQTAKAAKPDTKKPSKAVTNPAPDPLAARSTPAASAGRGDGPIPPLSTTSHASAQPRRTPRKPVLTDETAAVLPVTPITTSIAEPIVKVPTVEDIANIKVGTTESDLVAALGQPASRLTIPDDDGHLRETCQYWANGRALGTIRLDNGQVVTVETRPEN